VVNDVKLIWMIAWDISAKMELPVLMG
jgi:hypothetical protein